MRLFLFSLLCLLITPSLSAQEWVELSVPPATSHHTNGYGHEGKAYVIDGLPGTAPGSVGNPMWEYTPETDSWEYLMDFPGPPRNLAIGDDWNGRYYYGFGFDNNTGAPLNDLWVFDPEDMSWAELPECPCPGRGHPALLVEDGKVFMGAGSNNGNLNDWWEYRPLTQTWIEHTTMPGGARHHPYQFTAGDAFVVGGGHRTNWLRWDVEDEVWIEINNYPEDRVAGTQFHYKDKGYVLAGDDGDHTDNLQSGIEFLQYDPETDNWEELDPLPQGSRWAPASFIIDGKLYFLAGINYDNGNDQSMWRYDLDILDPDPMSDINNTAVIEGEVKVYPNPVQNMFFFDTELSLNGTYDLQVFDAKGQLIIQQNDISLEEGITADKLSSGIYQILLTGEENTYSARLMKF